MPRLPADIASAGRQPCSARSAANVAMQGTDTESTTAIDEELCGLHEVPEVRRRRPELHDREGHEQLERQLLAQEGEDEREPATGGRPSRPEVTGDRSRSIGVMAPDS